MDRRNIAQAGVWFAGVAAASFAISVASPASANFRRYPGVACDFSNNSIAHALFTPNGSALLWFNSTASFTGPCTIEDNNVITHSTVLTLNVHVSTIGGNSHVGAQACVNSPSGTGATYISCGGYSYDAATSAGEYTISVSDLTSWSGSSYVSWIPYLNLSIPPSDGTTDPGIIGYYEST